MGRCCLNEFSLSKEWSVKRIIATLGVLAAILLSLAGYLVYKNYALVAYQPMLPQGATPLIIELKPATSARTLVRQLYAQHLIRSQSVLLAFIRWRGISHRLQQGVYQIKPGETVADFINKVANGEVIIEPFRIEEGSTLLDLQHKLMLSPYLRFRPEDFTLVAQSYQSVDGTVGTQGKLEDIDGKASVKANGDAEGLFLADTYSYKAGSDATVLLKQANDHLRYYLEETWQTRDLTLPYKTAYELLIAASIIEKEAAAPDERKLISGIIVKRLKLKMPLQMDPTVIYALRRWRAQQGHDNCQTTLQPCSQAIPRLKHDDLAIKSPYNTYMNRGLPPTPIAMVGRESIDAAAHPEYTDYLYFYAKGDGRHQFSKTYRDQQQAIRQYKPKAVQP